MHSEPGKTDKAVAQKLREMSGKYKLKVTEITEQPNGDHYHIGIGNKLSPGEIELGGKDYHRAVAKIALNYYLSLNLDPSYCSKIRSFVKGDPVKQIFFYYSPTNEVVHNLADDEVSHIIHLRGIPEQRVLYAYVELFNMQNLIILFDMEYDGPSINATYCRDVIKNKDIEKSIALRLVRHHLEALKFESNQMGARQAIRFERLLKIIEKQQTTKL